MPLRELKLKAILGPPVCPKDGTPLSFMSTPVDAVEETHPPAVCWFCPACRSLWAEEKE